MPAYDGRRFAPPAPVAVVSVGHPDHEGSVADVPMLIDSGADVSLLPRLAVASIGIAGTGERFPLMAFDGSVTQSDVVHAELVFLGTRFRGRFPVVDAAVGVLGRNVLNHVRLVLDGPALRRDASASAPEGA